MVAIDNIVDPIRITDSGCSSYQTGASAGDRSGLNIRSTLATHDNNSAGHGTWLSQDNPEGDVWLQYDFSERLSLAKTYIWNFNQFSAGYPTLANAGLQYVKIMYTEDGINWKQFTNNQCSDTQPEGYTGMYRFAKATGEAALPATNLADGKGVLNFDGLMAKGIRFEIPNEQNIGNYGWYVQNDNRNNYGLRAIL